LLLLELEFTLLELLAGSLLLELESILLELLAGSFVALELLFTLEELEGSFEDTLPFVLLVLDALLSMLVTVFPSVTLEGLIVDDSFSTVLDVADEFALILPAELGFEGDFVALELELLLVIILPEPPLNPPIEPRCP